MAERRQNWHELEFPARVDCDDASAQACEVHAREPSLADHLCELLRGRKFADRFDKIAISAAVASHRFADGWNGREGVGVVQSIHDRQIDARKFEAQETPAALEHTISFPEGVFDAWHV